MFTWLASPGLEFSEDAEVVSDILLILATFVVVLGLIGEYMKGEWWKSRHSLFEMLVLVGVAGEMLFEGSAFWFSSRARAADDIAIQAMKSNAEPREIRAPTSDTFNGFAKGKATTVLVTSYAFDAESGRLSAEIVENLKLLGVNAIDDTFTLRPAKPIGYGVFVSGPNFALATALKDWANENGLKTTPNEMPSGGIDEEYAGGFRPGLPPADATISVGLKPLQIGNR